MKERKVSVNERRYGKWCDKLYADPVVKLTTVAAAVEIYFVFRDPDFMVTPMPEGCIPFRTPLLRNGPLLQAAAAFFEKNPMAQWVLIELNSRGVFREGEEQWHARVTAHERQPAQKRSGSRDPDTAPKTPKSRRPPKSPPFVPPPVSLRIRHHPQSPPFIDPES